VGAEPEGTGAASSTPAPELTTGPGRIARARETADRYERRARETYEQARARYTAVQLAAEAFDRDRARAGGLLAGGLAYRIFIWEIPLALFLVSALGLTAEFAGADPADLAREAGLSAAMVATVAQGVAASEQGRWWLLFLGAFLTVWAGRGVFRGLRLVSQLAWGERAPPQSTLKGSLAVTGLGLGLIAIQAFLPTLSDALGLPGVAQLLLGLVVATVVLTWALSLLPRADARWTAVIPGAVVLGVGFRLLGLAASTYFAYRLESSSDLYGALGIAIVFMLYLFLVARLFVAAQFLNATLYRRHAEEKLTRWAASSVSGLWEQGGDHHPEPGAADDVVGQVGADVHPPEADRSDHAAEDGPGPGR
jgi:uncharacterized BrkB/YihY/UPF0761 family membrane protein